jgi:hypothetical protein
MVLAAGLAGCGEAGSQQAAGEKNLLAAIERIDQAHQGFVPASMSTDGVPMELQTYRQDTLNDALAQLEKVIQSGTPQQQAAARRLFAEISASASRHLARQALAEYANLAARSTAMLSYLAAADRAAARAALFVSDDAAVTAELESARQTQLGQQQELQQRIEQLQSQRDQHEQQLAQSRQQADQAVAAASDFRQQAFVATGDEQYDLYDKAAEQDRVASSASAEAEKHRMALDVLDSQLVVLDRQQQLVRELLTDLEQEANEAAEQMQLAKQSAAAAEDDRKEAAQALAQEFEQVMAVYEQAVDGQFDQAAQRIAQAVQAVENVASQSAAERQAVQSDLLAALNEQTHTLTQHAIVAAGMAHTVGALAAGSERLGLPTAPMLTQALDQLKTKQDALIEQARAAVTAGQELTTALLDEVSEDSPMATFAQAQAKQLQTYAGQLQQVDLQ